MAGVQGPHRRHQADRAAGRAGLGHALPQFTPGGNQFNCHAVYLRGPIKTSRPRRRSVRSRRPPDRRPAGGAPGLVLPGAQTERMSAAWSPSAAAAAVSSSLAGRLVTATSFGRTTELSAIQSRAECELGVPESANNASDCPSQKSLTTSGASVRPGPRRQESSSLRK